MIEAHYHIYHHQNLEGLPAFVPGLVPVALMGKPGVTRKRLVQSLRNDMARLREDGAAKGIVDPGYTKIGASVHGKELLALKVGKGEKHKVLVVGCHHAREWISVEVPFLIAKYLIDNYTDAPSARDDDEVTLAEKKRIKHLLDNRQIWFVPMVNPDGHTYSMLRDRDWRANRQRYHLGPDKIVAKQHGGAGPSGEATREITVVPEEDGYRGVDINRNYPTLDWGHETYAGDQVQTSRDPGDCKRGVWCGPWPGSERETQAIVGLFQQNHFKAAISYHSYGKFLVYSDLVRSAPYLRHIGRGMLDLLNHNPDSQGHYKYQYINGDREPLYPITGHFADFCFEQSPGQPTFTNELPPHDKHPRCKQWAFSGLPESEIGPTFRENLGAALALINSAGFSQPADAQRICVQAGAHTVQVVDNCWQVFAGWTADDQPATTAVPEDQRG